MPERIAIYPGSFDPITLGHEDIARRALSMAERVIFSVAHTPSQTKRSLFDVEERLEIIREVFLAEPRIEATEFRGLLVDHARRVGATLVVRGLRGVADFEYEFQMARMNRAMMPTLETVFLAPDPSLSFISSSLVREISSLGGEVERFVSPAVLARMRVLRRG